MKNKTHTHTTGIGAKKVLMKTNRNPPPTTTTTTTKNPRKSKASSDFRSRRRHLLESETISVQLGNAQTRRNGNKQKLGRSSNRRRRPIVFVLFCFCLLTIFLCFFLARFLSTPALFGLARISFFCVCVCVLPLMMMMMMMMMSDLCSFACKDRARHCAETKNGAKPRNSVGLTLKNKKPSKINVGHAES